MTGGRQTTVRRATEADVRALAEREPQTGLLADERTIFLVAERGGELAGFAFGYLLPRRHGGTHELFVYEIGVEEPHRRHGVGKALLTELTRLGGGAPAFVLTDADNDAANALYRSLGGTRNEAVLWEW